MKLARAVLPLVAAAAAATAAHGAIPRQATVERVVQRLDMRSFPNSLRDRLREAGRRTRTLRQLGTQRFGWRDGVLEVWEADGSWLRSFRPLRSSRGRIRACFVDHAQNGGTYFARQALEFSLTAGGLYRARAVEDRTCATHSLRLPIVRLSSPS